MQNRGYQRIGVFVVGLLVVLLLIYEKGQESVQEESTYIEEQESKNFSMTLEESDLIKKNERKVEEEKEETDTEENKFIREKEYVNEYQNNYVHVFYPQITGFFEEEKEQRMNSIIEEDMKKLLVEMLEIGEEKDSLDVYMGGNLYFELKWDVKLLSKNIISIFYRGVNGGYKYGGKRKEFNRGLMIAVEEEKVLVLEDMITDMEELKRILKEDQFEPITMWDGEKKNYSEQIQLDPFMGSCFDEEGVDGIYRSGFEHMEWYTDGESFHLIFDTTMCYYEYSIKMDSIRYLFCEEFLNLLKQEEIPLEEEVSIEKEKK